MTRAVRIILSRHTEQEIYVLKFAYQLILTNIDQQANQTVQIKLCRYM